MKTRRPRSGAPTRQAPAKPARRRKIVLIVDEDRAGRAAMARALTRHAPRADIAMALGGADARDAIAFHRPDMVLVSARLDRACLGPRPGAGGPAIVTATDDASLREAARLLGAAEPLAPPSTAGAAPVKPRR
jgi:hypothetical protein